MTKQPTKLDDLLNQIGWIAYKAGRDKDTPNGKNLMEQSEISIERAKQAIYDLIEYVLGDSARMGQDGLTHDEMVAVNNRLKDQRKRAKELL